MVDADVGKKIGAFRKAMKSTYSRCLEPSMSCNETAIKAHTVQNATSMSLIEEKGHVSAVRMQLRGAKPCCEFSTLGRNEASTFTGLCNHHDTEIFKPIDTKALSLDDDEQLFLIAWRAVTRELHATLEGAQRIQATYLQQVEEGKIPKGETPQAVEATMHMLKAWGQWKYRYKYFDKDLVKGRFDNVLHSIIKIENEVPVLASASFFASAPYRLGRSFEGVIVNIIPTAATETVVLVSYARDHSGPVRRFFAPIKLERDASQQKLLLSQLIVNRMENFFLTPSKVAAWGDEKRRFIEKAYEQSITRGTEVGLDPQLMLF